MMRLTNALLKSTFFNSDNLLQDNFILLIAYLFPYILYFILIYNSNKVKVNRSIIERLTEFSSV